MVKINNHNNNNHNNLNNHNNHNNHNNNNNNSNKWLIMHLWNNDWPLRRRVRWLRCWTGSKGRACG